MHQNFTTFPHKNPTITSDFYSIALQKPYFRTCMTFSANARLFGEEYTIYSILLVRGDMKSNY